MADNKVPTTSPPAILRNRQLATWFYGQQSPGSRMELVPRYKFMFYARLVPNAAAITLYPYMQDLGKAPGGLAFKVKTMDKPKLDLTTVEVNQYNRRRQAYTRVEYQPTQMRLHDTVDNAALRVWKDYFTYYFGDSRGSKSSIMPDQVVTPEFQDGTGWGLRPLSEDLSLFARIELYSIFGGTVTQVNYLNPKITAIDWTQYDSSSSDPDDVNITFRYEALEYVPETKMKASLGENDVGLLDLLGWNTGTPAIEPDTGQQAPATFTPQRAQSDNTYASFINANQKENILAVSRSIDANLGLNTQAYMDFTNPRRGAGTASFVGSNQKTRGLNDYANSPNVANSILGVPNNALPSNTGTIDSKQFMVADPGVNSPIRQFGNFNFGRGAV